MSKKVVFETNGDVSLIRLTDAQLNLFGDVFVAELDEAVTAAERSSIRGLLILADGPHFSGGADVRIFQGKSAAAAREMFERYIPVIQRLEALPVPTLAAVQGFCLAAGLELALACDMIFAAQTARFSQVEALIGTTTLLGGAQRLAARVGVARAREIVYTADLYDARTFEAWHIVNRVVTDELLQDEAMAFIQRLAKGPTKAFAADKALVREAQLNGIEAADRLILDIGAALFETEDMQAGVERILREGARNARKSPRFKGC